MLRSISKALYIGSKNKAQKPDTPIAPPLKNVEHLSKSITSSLITAINFLSENCFHTDGLFVKPGDKSETLDAERFILGGIISVEYLQKAKNIHSIPGAIKSILSSHGPVIPYSSYDIFMSPLANHEQLILNMPTKNKELLECLLNLFAHMTQIQNKQTKPTISNLFANVGVLLMRDSDAPYSGLDKESYEYLQRSKVFAKLLSIYSARLSKQMADASPRSINNQNNQNNQKQNAFSTSAAAKDALKEGSADGSADTSQPLPGKKQQHSMMDCSVKVGLSFRPIIPQFMFLFVAGDLCGLGGAARGAAGDGAV